MSSDDIRTTFDLPAENHRAISQLHGVHPAYTSVKSLGFDSSGFDCLVIVIRRLLSHSYIVTRDDRQALDDEATNPVLQYAWSTFERDELSATDHAKRAAARTKRKMIAHLCGADDPEHTDTSFWRLATSAAMNATMWSNIRARYMLPEVRWVDGQTIVEELPARESMADRNMVRYDCTDPEMAGRTLQQVVNSPLRHWSDGKTLKAQLCGRPLFLRVLYKPNKEAPLEYSALRMLDMDWNTVQMHEDGLMDPESDLERYTLVAVVRMRRDEEEPDMVRTYTHDGRHLVPTSGLQKVTDDGWSLEETTGEYMLFYARSPSGRVNWACDEVHRLVEEVNPEARVFDAPVESFQALNLAAEAPKAPKDAPKGPKAAPQTAPTESTSRCQGNLSPLLRSPGQRRSRTPDQGASSAGPERKRSGSPLDRSRTPDQGASSAGRVRKRKHRAGKKVREKLEARQAAAARRVPFGFESGGYISRNANEEPIKRPRF